MCHPFHIFCACTFVHFVFFEQIKASFVTELALNKAQK